MENHKEFHLQRIDANIEKYSNSPVFDENIGQYFNPKYCKLCTTYNHEFTGKTEFNSICSMCYFAIPKVKSHRRGCVFNFPSYRRLLDAYMKIFSDCVHKRTINEEDKNEFLKWWAYRRDLFIKIKEILSELPDERFTEAGFKFFPEIWGIDNA